MHTSRATCRLWKFASFVRGTSLWKGWVGCAKVILVDSPALVQMQCPQHQPHHFWLEDTCFRKDQNTPHYRERHRYKLDWKDCWYMSFLLCWWDGFVSQGLLNPVFQRWISDLVWFSGLNVRFCELRCCFWDKKKTANVILENHAPTSAGNVGGLTRTCFFLGLMHRIRPSSKTRHYAFHVRHSKYRLFHGLFETLSVNRLSIICTILPPWGIWPWRK